MTNNINLRDYFNGLSKTYVTNEYASFFMTNYMRRHLINKVKSFKNKNVLDLMSGKGENLKYIKTKKNNVKITTLDFSTKMNEAAMLNHKSIITQQIENDFFEIDYNKATYDIILCSFGVKTIEHEKLNLFAKKITHLLKPNGEVLFLELVKPKKYLKYKFIEFYLKIVIPMIFGNHFKALFSYVNNYTSMDNLKLNMLNEKVEILEHKRVFDLFEIIHAKK